MTSPNMSLNLPVVQETLGPTYAQMNNEAFEVIDAHDHTDGKGVLVPTAGLNINLDLPMNGFALTEANAVTLQAVVGTPEVQSVYSSGGELWYRDASGTGVQITVGGAVDAGIGNITGLGSYTNSGPRSSSVLFDDLGLDFSFYYDGSKLGAINTGDIRLFPYSPFTAYSTAITVKAPTALSSAYTLTLATALPASTQLMQVSNAGQLVYSNSVLGQLIFEGGVPAAPSIAFNGDTNTGIYSDTPDSVTFSSGGTKVFSVNSNAIISTLPLYVDNGTVSIPTFSFSNDTNTGLYLHGSDAIGVTTGGTKRLEISTSTVESTLPIALPGGSDGSPTLTFAGDTNTGLFSAGSDILGFTTGGNQQMTVSSAGVNIAGGGAFKVKLVSSGTGFTLSAGGSSTRDLGAHGLTSSNIIGVISGAIDDSGIRTFGSVTTGSFPYPTGAYVNSTNVFVTVLNNTGSSNTFDGTYAIIFHV